MGWVGLGGGPNDIGGAFELSLAGLSKIVSLNGGMTAVPFELSLAGDYLPKTVTRYDVGFLELHAS